MLNVSSEHSFKICQKQITELQQTNEELEQCSRRFCLRNDGVPTVDNKTLDEVLDKVQSVIKKTNCDISDVVIEMAHRIGKCYNHKKTNACCKNIIACFTTLRHRTMFYQSRANSKNNVKFKLDLTKQIYIKNRYKICTKAIER